MGVKADNMQVGQSVTTTQNFNIRAPLDGTLRLSRGDAGAEVSDPIKIESNNDVTLAGNLLSGVLGTGQTWQLLTGSRALATLYTNTTGKPIAIYVTATSTVAVAMNITVNGVTLQSAGQNTAGFNAAQHAIIPPGATYSANLSTTPQTLTSWLELR